MSRTLKNVLFVIIVAMVLCILGFIREFVFENINAQLYTLWYDYKDYSLPASLAFFNSWTANELYYLKFPLTVLSGLAYFLVAIFTVRRFFPGKKFRNITFVVHVFVFALAGVFFLYGLAFDDYDHGYQFSRIFMDFLQSPLLLMILLPGFVLIREEKSSL